MECKHYHQDNFDGLTCDAFPKGIPDSIIDDGDKHDKPLPKQDNDIVFEAKE